MAKINKYINQQKKVSLPIYSANLKPDIIKCWADFLDQREWQLWTTLTTGHELTLPGARRSINKLSEALKQHKYPAQIFWVAEPFDTKEGFHIHALLSFAELDKSDDNSEAYKTLVNKWRDITADQTARIFSERYKDKDHGGGANSYVGKYMMKNKCDYDFIAPHIKCDDQQYHNEERHPGIEIDCKNRSSFAKWKKKQKQQSKQFKTEIKNGSFIPRDNSIVFDKPIYNPGIIISTKGKFSHKYSKQQNCRLTVDYSKHHYYDGLNLTVNEYQYRDEKYKEIIHRKGVKKPYMIQH